MSTTELKLDLIKNISSTDDILVLEEIKKFLKIGEYYDDEVYVFTPEQKIRIEKSLEQFHKGNFLTSEEAEKDILEWIE